MSKKERIHNIDEATHHIIEAMYYLAMANADIKSESLDEIIKTLEKQGIRLCGYGR